MEDCSKINLAMHNLSELCTRTTGLVLITNRSVFESVLRVTANLLILYTGMQMSFVNESQAASRWRVNIALVIL